MATFGGFGNPIGFTFLPLSGGTVTGALTLGSTLTMPTAGQILFGANGGFKGNSADGEVRLQNAAGTAGLVLNSLSAVSGFPSIGQSTSNLYLRTGAASGTINFQDNSGNNTPLVNLSEAFTFKNKLTAGTMTDNAISAGGVGSGYMRRGTAKFTWTNAMVTALGAVTAGDVLVCTLPAKTVITRAFIVIGTTAAGTTTLSVAVGTVSAGYIDYVVAVANGAQAAANTVYGDATTEIGTNLYNGTGFIDHLPSFTGTTAVNAHFISTGANLSAVTTCTGTIYLDYYILP